MWSFLAFSSHSFYEKNSSLFSDLISLVLSLFYLAPKFHWFYKHSINKSLRGVLLFGQYLNKLQGWKLFKQTCDIHFMLFTFQAFLGITTLILIWEVKKNFVSLLGRSMRLREGGGDKGFFRELEVCFSGVYIYFFLGNTFPPSRSFQVVSNHTKFTSIYKIHSTLINLWVLALFTRIDKLKSLLSKFDTSQDFAVQLIDISSYHPRIHLYMTSTAETSNKCVTIHKI